MSFDCYAVAAPGLEGLAAAELADLGIDGISVEAGGVSFTAERAGVLRANLHLRTASRVLVRMGDFEARGFSELERKARGLPWERFVRPGAPVRFEITSRKSKLYHTGAIEERLRGLVGADPKEAGRDALDAGPQRFVVRLVRDRCLVSADASGELLHRRGYRLRTARAPVRETLAAGMLLASGWDPKTPLVDPFCGAGTIPIEAALLARRIAPGLHRSFAFERWPGHDTRAWEELKAAAHAEALDRAPAPIFGYDRDDGAVRASRENAVRAGVQSDVRFERQTISELRPPAAVPAASASSGHDAPTSTVGALITNPPYGRRVGASGRLRDLYARLGQVVRDGFPGWRVALLSGDRVLSAQTRLALELVLRTRNGGIPVELLVA